MYVFFSLSLVGYAGTQKPDLLEPPTRQRAESELELKQAHMAQKPVLRVEVGARALSEPLAYLVDLVVSPPGPAAAAPPTVSKL